MNQKLKDLVEFGADIEFSYRGKDYVILPWTDDGIVIGPKDGEDSVYGSYDDMINNYVIDGMYLKDILEKIKIDFTSGC